MDSIKHNLATLRNHIANYEKKYQRAPRSVTLLAVTKKQPVANIQAAIDAGQRIFGENYLQEALEKIMALGHAPLEWHFIGPIQSNKTKKIAEQFDWVHSVDSTRIAQRLNDQRPKDLPPLNICLEVNLNDEITKSGVKLKEIFPLAEYCSKLPQLTLRGLMAIPAPQHSLAEQREQFKKLTQLFKQLRENGFMLDTLSMGMSDDYEAAIAEGSTLVRIGSAIFGPRI